MASKRDRPPARRYGDDVAREVERREASGGGEREERALKAAFDREITHAFRDVVRDAVAREDRIGGPGRRDGPTRARIERRIAETRGMSESAIARYEANRDKHGKPSTSDFDGRREDVAPGCDVFVHAVAARSLTLTLPGRRLANRAIARTLNRVRERERAAGAGSIDGAGVEVIRFFLANQPTLAAGPTGATADAWTRWPFADLLPTAPRDEDDWGRFRGLFRAWNVPFQRLRVATGYEWLVLEAPA